MKNNLEILYEDNHIIVVVKPENILSQGDSSGDDSMLDIVKEYIKVKYNKPGNVYLGLVHRLDRRVSGVMVFAKTSKAASRLSEAIRKNEFIKKYKAIVVGKVVGTGKLVHYLDKKDGIAIESKKDGKESVLFYNVLKNFQYFLVYHYILLILLC